MTKSEIAALMRAIHKAEVATEQGKVAKAALKEYMIQNGIESLSGGGFTANLKEVDSKRLDSAALKAAQPEVYEKFSKNEHTVRLYFK